MPILFMMFEAANLPRHLTIICLSAGSSTFVMTCLPGSPQLSNVVPTQFLGTTLTAAPILGTICGIALFILVALYGEWASKKAVKRGEVWSFPDNYNTAITDELDEENIPPAWKGLSTIVILLAILIIGSQYGINGTVLAVSGMLVGSLVTILLNMKKFVSITMNKWFQLISKGMSNGVYAINGIASIIAFGTVVRATPAFTDITTWLLSLQMNPYILGILCTGVICGITGGSSSGQRIMYDALAPAFIATGADLNIMHRLCAIASGSLDTLPHSSGLFVMFELLGLNHKSAYRHVFAVSVVAPLIVTAVATTFVVLLGY